MNRWLMAGALGIGVLLLHGAGPALAQPKDDAPGWLRNLNVAKLEAKKAGKPMFLVFR